MTKIARKPPAEKRLEWILNALEAEYGRPKRPKAADPLELVLLENVAYLLSDEKREKAFDALRKRVGLSPEKILAADDKTLLEIARMGGMLAEQRVEKLRFIALTVLKKFQGDLNRVLQLPLKEARKALRQFPDIAEPGAEKILLFAGREPVLALESNGLRVLNRLGYGTTHKNYATEYHMAQEAVKPEQKNDCAWLIRAHQLLRQHGQGLCKRTRPACHACPLTGACRFYQQQAK